MTNQKDILLELKKTLTQDVYSFIELLNYTLEYSVKHEFTFFSKLIFDFQEEFIQYYPCFSQKIYNILHFFCLEKEISDSDRNIVLEIFNLLLTNGDIRLIQLIQSFINKESKKTTITIEKVKDLESLIVRNQQNKDMLTFKIKEIYTHWYD